jgi:hypothetical protein
MCLECMLLIIAGHDHCSPLDRVLLEPTVSSEKSAEFVDFVANTSTIRANQGHWRVQKCTTAM